MEGEGASQPGGERQDGRHLMEGEEGQDGGFPQERRQEEDGAQGIQGYYEQDKQDLVFDKRVAPLNSKSFCYHVNKWYDEVHSAWSAVDSISNIIN